MTDTEKAAAAVKLMEQLSEVFGEAVAGILHGSVVAIKQMTDAPDTVVFAAAVNGSLLGLLTYMEKQATDGRLSDPDADLSRVFHLAGTAWEGICSGEEYGKVTLQ